ncbi:CbtB domain-containing protein [Lysobacter korlensis]|uniref:CbtB domain-containing protein n=1 Tax=Lysobacter korlensis TaxID=553636 RepID=A0ABV6RS26_9GAMM
MPVTPGLSRVQINSKSRTVVLAERIVSAALALGLGLVVLYGAAFSEMPEVHNAAHDGRHSAGFPCH